MPKIPVSKISQDLLDKLPDNIDDLTNEELLLLGDAFLNAIMPEPTVNAETLPPDFDGDELTYTGEED